MNHIEQRLDQLATLEEQRQNIAAHYEVLRNSVFTPEIIEKLAEIDAEQNTALAVADEGITRLREEIKAAVLDHGQTVRGARLAAVWTKGRVSWDTKALDGYAAAHPEIAGFRKEGEPSISIRAMK